MQKRAGGVEFLIPGGRVNRAGRRFIQIGTRHFVSRSPPINLNFGQFIFRLETERSNALTNNSRFDLCDCLSRNLAHGLNIDSIFIDYRICQRFISDYAPLPIYTVRGITRIGKI